MSIKKQFRENASIHLTNFAIDSSWPLASPFNSTLFFDSCTDFGLVVDRNEDNTNFTLLLDIDGPVEAYSVTLHNDELVPQKNILPNTYQSITSGAIALFTKLTDLIPQSKLSAWNSYRLGAMKDLGDCFENRLACYIKNHQEFVLEPFSPFHIDSFPETAFEKTFGQIPYNTLIDLCPEKFNHKDRLPIDLLDQAHTNTITEENCPSNGVLKRYFRAKFLCNVLENLQVPKDEYSLQECALRETDFTKTDKFTSLQTFNKYDYTNLKPA